MPLCHISSVFPVSKSSISLLSSALIVLILNWKILLWMYRSVMDFWLSNKLLKGNGLKWWQRGPNLNEIILINLKKIHKRLFKNIFANTSNCQKVFHFRFEHSFWVHWISSFEPCHENWSAWALPYYILVNLSYKNILLFFFGLLKLQTFFLIKAFLLIQIY